MKRNRLYILAVVAVSIVVIAFVTLNAGRANESGMADVQDSIPSRRQLRRSFFEKRAVLVVYGADDAGLASRYKALLDSLSRVPEENSWRNVSVSSREAGKVKPGELDDQILFLVGTPGGNPMVREYSTGIPVRFDENAFYFDADTFEGADQVLSVNSYPNPQNDTLPVSLLSGNDAEAVYRLFSRKVREGGRSFFRQPMDYEIYQGSRRIVMGDFNEEWGVDASTKFDFSGGNKLVHTSEHFDYISHNEDLSLFDIISLADEIEETTDKILAFTGKDTTLPKMAYHIYRTAEEKGLMLGNTDQANFDADDHSVHTVLNEEYQDNFIEKENALLLDRLLGEAQTKAMERGLPVYFTDQWQREGYAYWTSRLFESGNAITLPELLSNESLSIESPLIADCMSASLVGFLLEAWGRETFLERYASWEPTKKEMAGLVPAWQRYLENMARAHPRKERQAAKLPFLKGFNFAHEGYSIYNGYVSRMATESLQKQRLLGSNAVAIIPYSFIRDTSKPAPFRFSDHAGGENDAGVVHSAFEAKELGMVTVLKPQVFAGGSWPGDVEMTNEADWQAFFAYYHKWIRHYALLAEIHQMDVLCAGVEFAKATLSHEDEWRSLFRELRGLYQGNLTYAANWGPEFEKVGFWDDLDFIGLNCYYPLSKGDDPSREELKSNFDSVKTRITRVYEKYQKPIVFTEIGFRSINAPWKSPHAEGDDSRNEGHQQLCYEVVFEGIKGEPWCGGILWWKFPSYLGYQGLENDSFTPNHKQAEATVRDWFLKLP